MGSGSLPFWVNCSFLLSQPLSSAGFASFLCTHAFCWFSQHSHRGVDILIFFFFWLLVARQRQLLCVRVGKKARHSHCDVNAGAILAVIPKEGVSVESHYTHSLWVELRVRGLDANLCGLWRQSKCDNETVVKHMLGVMFRRLHYHSICRLCLCLVHKLNTNTHTHLSQNTVYPEQL